jgi:single-stranded DNA-binding protein
MKPINPRTSVTAFQLSTVESWKSGNGEIKERKNRVQIEVVGRDAERIFKEVHLGSWVTIEGYIRSENFKGQTMMKVRTLSIETWEN